MPDRHTTAGKIADLERRRYEAVHAGSAQAVEKQHARGKLTARERIDLLLDEGSFIEFDELARHRAHDFGIQANRPYGDGVVTGYGTVDGRPVCVFSQDFTVFGGSLGEVYGEKIVKVMDHAMKTGCPVIGINDGGGARIQEGVVALGLFAEIFFRNTRASGVIPQISLIMGPAAGGAVYSPAITDFTLMVRGTSHMFITGPDVIKTVTGEDVTFEDLGGAHAHAAKSGVAHYQAESTRRTASPSPGTCCPTCRRTTWTSRPFASSPELTRSSRTLRSLTRTGRSTRSSQTRRTSPTTCTRSSRPSSTRASSSRSTRHSRRTSSSASAGSPGRRSAWWPTSRCTSPAASTSTPPRRRPASSGPATRSASPSSRLSTCRASCPGSARSGRGIIRRGAKLIYAYAEATVPKVTVITRKAYGGAYDVMGSKHLGGDVNLAWPTAQIAVMGAQGAVNILYRRELASAENPEQLRAQQHHRIRGHPRQPVYRRRARLPGRGDPPGRDPSRRHPARCGQLRTKRETLPPKKHGNIPL